MSQVWLCLLLSMVIGVASLYGIFVCIFWIDKKYRPNSPNRLLKSNLFIRAFDFIFGLVVAQG